MCIRDRDRYAETCGGVDLLGPVKRSAALLMAGAVDYEFRTTVCAPPVSYTHLDVYKRQTVLYASLMGLPVPFAAVHLLFINLLTDSLPAIALGLEPHTDEVMLEKPRPRNEGILTKPFLFSVGIEGLVIAAATVTAFYLGLNVGGAAAGPVSYTHLDVYKRQDTACSVG